MTLSLALAFLGTAMIVLLPICLPVEQPRGAVLPRLRDHRSDRPGRPEMRGSRQTLRPPRAPPG